MMMHPIAAISDIHGNRWALESVLRDMERRKVNHIVNLGDSLYGPLDPDGTARILIPLDWPTVRGNEDRMLVEPPENPVGLPSLDYVRKRLKPDHFRWLETLEMTRTAYEHFFLCHGTPDRDDEYLLEEVSKKGVFPRSSSEVEARVGRLEQPVLFCGHDHVPRTVYLRNGHVVVNPGSVGLPAYRDDLICPHVMETGTPHARYSIVHPGDAGWSVEEVSITYDWESAAAAAMKNGRPDWAKWLRTGRATAQ